MKILTVIKGVISYILALVLAVIFALYINASVGWFLCVALILALVLSVFFALFTKRSISVECDVQESLLSKRDKCVMSIRIKNRSIFPTTPIELIILNDEGIKTTDKNIIVSVMPRSEKNIEVVFDAKISGLSTVGIESIVVTDYIGLLGMKLDINYNALQKKLAVIPDIAKISPKDERILKVMQASNNSEDSEDTTENTTSQFGGFPGYDNREYIPGDPMKRINWKQSAKRNKLLVRLDDEVAASAVNIILDSVFKRDAVDIVQLKKTEKYYDVADDEILASIAEDAVENALGLARVLVLSNYNVNFFTRMGENYVKYPILDEKDVENARVDMAQYAFDDDENLVRYPTGDAMGGVSVYVTPNSSDDTMDSSISVFSVLTEALQGKRIDTTVMNLTQKSSAKKESLQPVAVTFLLAMVLSITVMSAYRVPVMSVWTLVQTVMCLGMFAVCSFARKHKIIGTMLMTIIIFTILATALNLSFSGDAGAGMQYMQWFMSGGDLIDGTVSYLLSLILVFTSFFALVIYFYSQVKYRTSALLFVSLVPCIMYAKIVKEMSIIYIMLTIILNIFVLIIHTRKPKDRDKKIVAHKTGWLSVGLYGLCFVLMAMAVPKSSETKYYSIFEEVFLGGNTTTILPIELRSNSEFSGNADNFNRLNNRKLYTVSGEVLDYPLYLKRQTYDYYDYEKNHWYADDYFSKSNTSIDNVKSGLDTAKLVEAILKAEELNTGFVDKYGLSDIKMESYDVPLMEMDVVAHNFATNAIIVPTRLKEVELYNDGIDDDIYYSLSNAYVDKSDDSVNSRGNTIFFYEEFALRTNWIDEGGANCTTEEAIEMLDELERILHENDITYYDRDIASFKEEAIIALTYANTCAKSNKEIPDKVKKLALDITKDCKYDWEKAEALERYFLEADLRYDLTYDAPDDSVEYFLFEGKTGTCSDFASAYALMARAAGLSARYVEGFVPGEEAGVTYDIEYVARTNSAHAYVEVYIQNFGFTVYEPTVAAIIANDDDIPQGGLTGYVLTLGMRLFIIFVFVSLISIISIIIGKILIPYIKERLFLNKVHKASPEKAVILLYNHIVDKSVAKLVKNANIYTPREFELKLKRVLEFDISDLCKMVEMTAYRNVNLTEEDKSVALRLYSDLKIRMKRGLE